MKLSYDDIIKKFISENEIKESSQSHRLTEGAKYKKGQKVQYQLDRGSSKALKPSVGTISKVKMHGKYCQYTIQDGGPVPVWGAEIIGLAEGELTEDYSQRARNFRVALRRRLEKMKPGQVIRYGKQFWTAQGKNNFRDSLRNKTFPNGRMTPGQDVVQALKFAVQSDIMKHRGAAGDDMVNAYLKFEGKLNEGKNLSKREVRNLKIKISNARTIGKYFTKDEVEFLTSLFESTVNESMIGIQTKANFKPNTLKGALERAGMKGFQMNRLSVTLTALKLDKKDFEKAKKIIDAMPTAKIMTAKESVNEDRDIGHQDDEPNMLKSTALEIMEYGKKLMDKLDAYDDMEEEVDFPNWWQAKLIVSKEYLQKAYHYLDSEEKTEESVNENRFNRPPDGFDWNKARADAKKAVADQAARDKEAAKEKKQLMDAIKMFRAKIKKQGRITNARDEEHLKKLIDLYKMKYPMDKLKERVNESMGINDPVLVAIRAMKTQMKKKTPVKKIKKVSFDQYLKLIGIQEDLVEDMKDTAEDIQDLFRNMEQEAEPSGGPIADKYGAQLDKLEKKYADLKKKKAVVDKKIENYRMS